jgi:hypothetical protein
MKELTLQTMLAVFEDMFGFWLFWALVAAAAIVTALYLFVLIRDRHVGWRKFLIAQVFMPVGAVLAVLFVMWVTHSHVATSAAPSTSSSSSASPHWGRWGWRSSSTRSSRCSSGRSGGMRPPKVGYINTYFTGR